MFCSGRKEVGEGGGGFSWARLDVLRAWAPHFHNDALNAYKSDGGGGSDDWPSSWRALNYGIFSSPLLCSFCLFFLVGMRRGGRVAEHGTAAARAFLPHPPPPPLLSCWCRGTGEVTWGLKGPTWACDCSRALMTWRVPLGCTKVKQLTKSSVCFAAYNSNWISSIPNPFVNQRCSLSPPSLPVSETFTLHFSNSYLGVSKAEQGFFSRFSSLCLCWSVPWAPGVRDDLRIPPKCSLMGSLLVVMVSIWTLKCLLIRRRGGEYVQVSHDSPLRLVVIFR